MDAIELAFEKAPRTNFVLPGQEAGAALDMPQSIGFGQTISQPTTVELMLEWLEVEPGNKVLDVGSGSGWTTALLSHLTGPSGKVYAVELIPELLRFGEDNCRRLGIDNAEFYPAGKVFGLPRFGPYDRILVSAAATELPPELVDQLAAGGKLVIPVGHEVLEIAKFKNQPLEIISHPGFVFVPLVSV